MSIHNRPQDFLNLDADVSDGLIKFPERKFIDFSACNHQQIIIDSKALEVTCKKCGEKVNAVSWMIHNMEYICSLNNEIDEKLKRLREDEEELKRRARTRCVHCRKMTSINLKYHSFRIL